MSSLIYDSRTADKFVVRLPDGLRHDIEAAANASDRSMNSVFVQAVRQYLDGQNRQQILLDVLANTFTTPKHGGVLGPKNGPLAYERSPVETFNIDDHVRLVADAERCRCLRNKVCIEDADSDLMVVRGDRYFNGEEMDREIDNALRLARLAELQP